MKKILSLVCLLMLAMTSAWAGEVATFDLSKSPGTSTPAGFFTHEAASAAGKWNWNSKFKDAEYDGMSFSQGLKMEGATAIDFTTTDVSTVTIVQSTWSANTIKLDGTELAIADAADGTGCRIYTVADVPAGDHVIARGSGESGLFYIKVEWEATKTVTFINDANWETVNVYAWDKDNKPVTDEWPGTTLTEKDLEGNYIWSTKADPIGILFNNGSAQTIDLIFKDGGVYNSTGRVITLNDYSATFKTDGMTEAWAYVWNGDEKALGEWPGTKMEGGNGEFSIAIKAEEAPKFIIFHNNAGDQTPDLEFEDGKAYEYNLNEYTATFTTDAAWETVYAYAWTTTGEGTVTKEFLGAWPGTAITAADGIYSLSFKSFDAPEKIIFNGGDGNGQTPDLAFNTGRAYKWNTTLDPLFKLEASEDKIPAGTTVEVKNGEDVVATLTYGVSGGADFAAPSLRLNEEYAAFQYYTGGNGENGTADGGTVYTIVPKYDGTITVGVWLNANKAFFIEEDGTALADYNGIKATYGSGTAFEFAVKANSEYKIYCTGSKLGFYGFDYNYGQTAGQTFSLIFKTNAGWQDVYAYVWTGEGQDKVLGEWPGTKMSYSERYDQYELSFEAEKAPEKIIFSDGVGGNEFKQTGDLDFENEKIYQYTVELPAATTATFDFTDPNIRENIGEKPADPKGNIYNETFTANGATLQVTSGSAASKIYADANRGQCLVTYKEYTTLTFRAPEGKAITKIEFTAAGNSNIKNFTASSGAIEDMTWTGNATGVRFLQGGTSYLANAIVTLEDAGDATAALPAIEYTECANIAAFNALEAGTYAMITLTNAEVIGKSHDGYSTVWIQDATGGAWIQYTSLNDRLQEMTKLNGTVYTIKRVTAGNPHLKEAEDTPKSAFTAEAINELTVIEGSTIAAVNVPENLNRVVKLSGATLEETSATAGTLTLGEETIGVNNGAENANQMLHKIADWAKDTKLENITIVAILAAKSATENYLFPISIERTIDPGTTYYTVAGGYEGVEAGTDDPILGKAWDPTIEENEMKKGEDGTYSLVKEGVMLKAGKYEYKVVENYSWNNPNYPADFNAALNIENAGFYNVTFTFNAETKYVDASLEAVSATETLNVERYPGLGYGTTEATVDFTAAKEYLGVEELTTSMLRVINPDGTIISDYATYDGWFNGEGTAETWGTNAKINVKFFQAIPEGTYSICDMNGADEVGKTYTVNWALTANDKYFIYNINVTFVEAPEAGDITISDLSIVTSVEYENTEASYIEKVASLTDEQMASIKAELGLESLSDAVVYVYNPTTKEMVFDTNDGWRDANGDSHGWAGNAEVPVCVKYTDGQNYLCYNIQGCDPQTIKTYWAITYNKKAVLVEVDFIYTAPAAIELTLTGVEVEVGVKYDVNEEDYTVKSIILTAEQTKSILDAIELESLENAAAYIYDPVAKEFAADNFDGWRGYDGLGHNWSYDGASPICVKFQNSEDIACFNFYGIEPQTITTYWAVANPANGKAALIKVNFTYEGTFPTYTVVGVFGEKDVDDADEIFGKAWDLKAEANKMTKTSRTNYTLTIEDVELAAGTIFYKVVENQSWDKSWGFPYSDENLYGNANYVVNMPDGFEKAVFDITFTFSPLGLNNGYNVDCDVVFDEQASTVGINSLSTKNQNNEAIYNLQGVRLVKLQKGLNIVGGKKVVVK